MAPNEPRSAQLDDIQKPVESINGTIQDQVSSVDGLNYATQRAWLSLVDVKDKWPSVAAMVSLPFLAAVVTAFAVVAHVIHH